MSNTQIQPGGSPVPVAPVFRQEGPAAGTFEGHVDHFHAFALKGSVWSVASADTMARLDPDGGAACAGILTDTIAHPNVGHDTGVFQTTGVIKATTAEWDAVVDSGSGGLSPGQVYNASILTPGNISDAIIGAGHVAIRIGIALDAETLILQISRGIAT